MTAVPTLSLWVRAIVKVIATSGSRLGPLIRSVNHKESNPSRSSSSTMWPSVAPSARSVAAPNPNPMRIFMGLF
jgi:hypothetical protein